MGRTSIDKRYNIYEEQIVKCLNPTPMVNKRIDEKCSTTTNHIDLQNHLKTNSLTRSKFNQDTIYNKEDSMMKSSTQSVEDLDKIPNVMESIKEEHQVRSSFDGNILDVKKTIDCRNNSLSLESNSLKCFDCGKSFSHKHVLNAHIKGIHEKIRDSNCEKCDYSSSYKSALNRHIRL